MCSICAIVGQAHEDSLVSTDVYVTTSSKPVAGLSQVVGYLTTQWPGQVGTTRSWSDDALTYSVPSSSPEFGSQESTGFQTMTAGMKAAAREAFELWDDLIAISLTETTSAAADVTFAYSSRTMGGGNYTRTYTSYTGTSDVEITRAHVWLNEATGTHDADADLFYGGYGRLTYVHEIGHALGLSHPGTYDVTSGGSISYASSAKYAQDTRAYTVMSYFQASSDGSGIDHVGTKGTSYAASPLLHDIAAIQAKYGADMTTRTGNTVYGFGDNTGRDAFDFVQNPNPVVAIWDAGGIDTLNVSGFTTDQRISLVAGTFSDVGALTNNVAIAFKAVVENAIGGSGDDEIEGNGAANLLSGGAGADSLWGAAGDDTLQGGDGSDLLYGGSGRDVFVFANGGDADRVADFDADADLIRLSNVTDFSDVVLATVSGGVRVSWGGADSVVLAGVSLGELSSTRFRFGTSDTAPPSDADEDDGPILSGDGASNVLVGTAEDDVLVGAGGNDRLEGGRGADRIDGGDGFDEARFISAASGVTIDLASGARGGEAVGDAFVSIERFLLSAYADVFVGSDLGEMVIGGGGADRLNGGGGKDKLVGGSGADLFVFKAGSGHDRILDFEDGSDRIDLRALSSVDDLSDLVVTSVTGGVRLSWDDGDASVVLVGIGKSDLDASDFLFG